MSTEATLRAGSYLRKSISRCTDAAYRFFSEPASPMPLGVLRILVCAVLLTQAFLLSPDLFALYGDHGLLQGSLNNYLIPPFVPCVAWFQAVLGPLGVSTDQTVMILFVAYVGSLATLLIGHWAQLAAFLAWLFHFTLLYSTGALSAYGVDSFAHILLFYFIFMPVGAALSLDKLRGVEFPEARYNRLALRILQLHLCIAYFVAGTGKAAGQQWWDGEAIWRATAMPDFSRFDTSWLVHLPFVAKVVAWSTVFFETLYPVFVWPRRTRGVWLTTIILMHAGIFFIMGLKTFAALMIVLNLALFMVPAQLRTKPSYNQLSHL